MSKRLLHVFTALVGIKRNTIAAAVLILGLLLSSCGNLSPTTDYSGDPSVNREELQKLQQQIGQLQNDKKVLQSQFDGLCSVWSADLTGDGKNETITAPPSPAPVSLFEKGGPLKVESADGNILMDEKSGILGAVGVYNVGANKIFYE